MNSNDITGGHHTPPRRTRSRGAMLLAFLGMLALLLTMSQTALAGSGSGGKGIPGGETWLRNALQHAKHGDILLARGPVIWKIYPPWSWKKGDYSHAGLFDKEKFEAGDSNCILSANKKGVRYENIRHWAKDQDKVVFYRIKNYSAGKAKRAVDFAKSIRGKGYNITATLNDNRKYYCSKVVYRAWKAAGEGSFKTFSIRGINTTDKKKVGPIRVPTTRLYYISPKNIAQSKNVKRVYPDKEATPSTEKPATCSSGRGTWNGCRGTGCSVCAEKLSEYPRYFDNHPNCVKNTTCGGRFFRCSTDCPAPTSADR